MQSCAACEITQEHVTARISVADFLRARARVGQVETCRQRIIIAGDLEDDVAAFVVDAVSKFRRAFLDKFRQVLEVADIRRHDGVREFVSKRPVQQARAVHSGGAVNVGGGNIVKITHVDVEHKLRR